MNLMTSRRLRPHVRRHDRDFKLSGGNSTSHRLYLSSTGVDTTARHTTSALFLYQTVDLLRIHY